MESYKEQMLSKIAQYKTKLIVAGAVLAALAIAVSSTYYVAYNKGLNVSKVEITQYEGQVQGLRAELTAAQGKVTTEIQTVYLDRVVERERIVYRNRDVIITQVPEQYILSRGWVYAHDQAALGRPIDSGIAANTEPSEVTDRSALNLVADNYGTVCRANTDQLTALQSWINQQREAYEETISNR